MASTPLTDRVIARARKLGCTVYTHDQWGAARTSTYVARLASRPVTRLKADTLVAHITVTVDDGPLSGDFFRDMRDIEQIGWSRFGSGVSYNFVVDHQTGEIGLGQFLEAKGTHTVNDKGAPNFSRDQNAVARAVAMLGMPGNPLTAKARAAWTRLMAAMILEGALTEDPDHVPHSLFAWKDCPTDTVRDQLPGIKRDAQELARQIRELETGPPVIPPPDPEPTTWVPFTVATYNVGGGPGKVKRGEVTALLDMADAVCLQEVGDRGDDVIGGFDDWQLVRGQGLGRGKTAVIVPADRVRGFDLWPCTARRFVGRLGAGPSIIDRKWIAWAKVHVPDAGRTINVGSTHLVPSVQRPPFPGRTRRREVWDAHATQIRGWFEDRKGHGPALVAGDFNATPHYAGAKKLRAAGLEVATAKSHGRRAIDQVWWRTQPQIIRLVSVEAVAGFSSDHRPVVARFEVAVKPPVAPPPLDPLDPPAPPAGRKNRR